MRILAVVLVLVFVGAFVLAHSGALDASLMMILCAGLSSAQNQLPSSLEPTEDNQINVNWFYGSYVAKEVPLKSLNGDERLKLYIRQTYTACGISDQAHHRYPEWGDGFEGFAKRLGTRQAEFRATTVAVAVASGHAHATPSSEISSPTILRRETCGLSSFHTFVRIAKLAKDPGARVSCRDAWQVAVAGRGTRVLKSKRSLLADPFWAQWIAGPVLNKSETLVTGLYRRYQKDLRMASLGSDARLSPESRLK